MWLHAACFAIIAVWWVSFLIWQPGFVSLIQNITYHFSTPPNIPHSLVSQATKRAIEYATHGGMAQSDIFFTKNEVSHLLDVYHIEFVIRLIITSAVTISWAILLSSLAQKVRFAKRSFLYAAIFLLVAVIFLTFALLFFSSFFIQFHLLLFPHGNWEFPETSMLITLFPQLFWELEVASILSLFLLFSFLYFWFARLLKE